jgi:hypothetical protein
MTIRIDSVQTSVSGARPHVGEEVFKFTPPSTDFDTSAAIVFVEGGFRIVAPLHHGSPANVLWSACFIDGSPVLQETLGSVFPCPASTAFVPPLASDVIAGANHEVSARTEAQPVGVRCPHTSGPCDCESSELSASNILKVKVHSGEYITK